jgi:uncharacterized membrane protein
MQRSTPQRPTVERPAWERSTPQRPALERPKHGAVAIAVLVAVVCLTNIWILSGADGSILWIGATAGFLLAVALPAWMLSQKVEWRTHLPSERLCYSVVTAIFGLIVVGLIINTVLPHLGVSRPLDRDPVLLAIDAWCGGIALWRRDRFRPTIPRPRIDRLNGADLMVGSLAALCVPVTVVGANRLNNGASGMVALIAFALAALVFILMFVKREQLNPGTISAAIYFIGLAMLLVTSLRGWYITGHDIQTEYRVFELTKSHGFWDISFDQGGYNSCLSLTILPTMLWQVTRVDDPYIYKFWFQLLFALCPVMVYCISARHMRKAIAIIAVIFFVSFPTYSTDMPFLNRQEIAFLFVAASVMVAANQRMSKRETHIRIGIFSIGVVLSHYSTSYVFFGTLASGWGLYKAWALFRRMRDRSSPARPAVKRRRIAVATSLAPAISLANVVLVLFAIVLWDGLATHTSTNITSTISQAVQSFRGGTGAGSGSASYGVLHSQSLTPPQIVADYAKNTLKETVTARASGVYYPQALIDKYPVSIVPAPNLPVTAAGNAMDSIGLNVATLNSIVRSLSARLLQLLVVVGLLASILSRRRQERSFVELIGLSCGALAIVALQVVLPVISVDYGVLRAFLQALIVFGPFVAIGCFVICRPLGGKWSYRLAYTLAIAFFLSLTGVIPQLLGGYPAQLDLNNSGEYYDIYYVHPQEISAFEWAQNNIPANQLDQVQSEVESDRYNVTLPTSYAPVSTGNDIYPTLLRMDSYVFLGYANIVKDQATFDYDGSMLAYTYPLGLLQSTRDLLYSSDGAQIYR